MRAHCGQSHGMHGIKAEQFYFNDTNQIGIDLIDDDTNSSIWRKKKSLSSRQWLNW
jgi:hypothetical protein